METFLWVEKHRPKSINECVLPDHLKNTFKEFVEDKHVPNLILSGSSLYVDDFAMIYID